MRMGMGIVAWMAMRMVIEVIVGFWSKGGKDSD